MVRGLRAGASLTQIRGLPSRGRLLGLSDMCGRPRCLLSVRVLLWMCMPGSVASSAIDGVTGEVFRARLVPAPEVITAWIAGCRARARWCTSPGRRASGWPGAFSAEGIRCEVAAASKLQRLASPSA